MRKRQTYDVSVVGGGHAGTEAALAAARRDGTTHVLFEPLDFTAPAHPCARGMSASMHVIARRAALVPRPRAHLVRYHGLFAPNAQHRQHIVTGPASMPAPDNGQGATGDTREPKPSAPMSWMQRLGSGFLLRSTSPIPGVVCRVFDIDLRICPRCGGGQVRVIAAITEPALIARILKHRDSRDDFSGKAPAGGARAPPAVSLH